MVRLHFALLCLYTMNSLSDLVLENSIHQIASTAAKAAPSSLCLCNKRCLQMRQLCYLSQATSFQKVSGRVKLLSIHFKTPLKKSPS